MEDELFVDEFRPFRRGELALARKVVEDPLFLLPGDLDSLRWALRLAQLSGLRRADDLLELLSAYRLKLLQVLAPVLPTDVARIEPEGLHTRLPRVRALAADARDRILRANLASPTEIDTQVCHKQVAVVMGGAAGSGYVFAGALARLEGMGIRPAYLSGCSLGAIIAVLRAREPAFDIEALLDRLGGLRGKGVLGVADPTPSLCLPALLRLDLDAALGGLLGAERAGSGERSQRRALGELAIPTDVLCTGLSAGAADAADGPEPTDPVIAEELRVPAALPAGPRPLDDLSALRGDVLTRATHRAISIAMSRRLLRAVYLGSDSESARLPALDAAAMSAAIPSLLQASPPASDPAARECLRGILSRHRSVALVDGGLSSLVPARHAWRQIEAGRIGGRNCAIVALDSVDSARGANAPLAPLLRLIHASAYRDRPFWDLHIAFERSLPLLELLPSARRLRQAVEWGEVQAGPTLRVLAALCEPLPAFSAGNPIGMIAAGDGVES